MPSPTENNEPFVTGVCEVSATESVTVSSDSNSRTSSATNVVDAPDVPCEMYCKNTALCSVTSLPVDVFRTIARTPLVRPTNTWFSNANNAASVIAVPSTSSSRIFITSTLKFVDSGHPEMTLPSLKMLSLNRLIWS